MDNTSENLLNKIRQNVYSLFRENEITKKVFNTIMNSIVIIQKGYYLIKMDIKTSNPKRLLLNLSDKANLKRSDKYVALSNLSICRT